MARLFDDAASEYLVNNNGATSDVPLTMACWFYTDDNSSVQTLMGISESNDSEDYFALWARGDVAGDPVRATMNPDGAGLGEADSTSGFSLNTWHHACAVFSADDARAAYLDGGNKGTNSDSAPMTPSLDRTSIAFLVRGESGGGFPFSGRICEAAIWNVALTDAEAAILALGFSPLFVRPQSLVAYWPLIRTEDQDWVGGFDMTPQNTPSVAAHVPKIIYPAMPQIITAPAAAAAAVTHIATGDVVLIESASGDVTLIESASGDVTLIESPSGDVILDVEEA